MNTEAIPKTAPKIIKAKIKPNKTSPALFIGAGIIFLIIIIGVVAFFLFQNKNRSFSEKTFEGKKYVTFDTAVQFKGVGRDTWFPYFDSKNYIRGDTIVDGNIIGTLTGLIESSNKLYRLNVQNDGNLCLYERVGGNRDVPLWCTMTNKPTPPPAPTTPRT